MLLKDLKVPIYSILVKSKKSNKFKNIKNKLKHLNKK